MSGAAQPALLFDYYGFPEEAYALSYPCPGSPDLARRIVALLTAAGVGAQLDDTRGLDHGVVAPLMLVFPEASIPVVEVSLHASLDPARHVKLGAALAPLRREGVLIVGSGFTTHNLHRTLTPAANDAFADWVNQVVRDMDVDALMHWAERAPHARAAHPREDHLLPLHAVMGCATSRGDVILDERINGPLGPMAFTCYQFV